MAAVQVRCNVCGGEFPENVLRELMCGDLVCESCFLRRCMVCDYCRDADYRRNGRWLEGGRVWVCEYCYEHECAICDECGDAFYYDRMHHTDDGLLCEDCFAERYSYCRYCGEVVAAEELLDGYCPDCYRECRSVILPYCKTKGRVFLGNGVHYGVELEVEAKDVDAEEAAEELWKWLGKRSKYFELKRDSSLQNGFEIVSQPATLRAHKAELRWREILETLKGLGCRATRRCGLHIHVGKDAVSRQAEDNIVLFMATAAEQVKKLSRRTDMYYCKLNHEAAGVSEAEPARKKVEAVSRMKMAGRYCALNVSPRDTVELRLFAATLNPTRFYGSLEFYDAIITFAHLHSVATMLAPQAWQRFVEFVQRQPQYPNLQRLLRDV